MKFMKPFDERRLKNIFHQITLHLSFWMYICFPYHIMPPKLNTASSYMNPCHRSPSGGKPVTSTSGLGMTWRSVSHGLVKVKDVSPLTCVTPVIAPFVAYYNCSSLIVSKHVIFLYHQLRLYSYIN